MQSALDAPQRRLAMQRRAVDAPRPLAARPVQGLVGTWDYPRSGALAQHGPAHQRGGCGKSGRRGMTRGAGVVAVRAFVLLGRVSNTRPRPCVPTRVFLLPDQCPAFGRARPTLFKPAGCPFSFFLVDHTTSLLLVARLPFSPSSAFLLPTFDAMSPNNDNQSDRAPTPPPPSAPGDRSDLP